VRQLHVEYAERGTEYGILFIFSLFCEYIHLEYVRIHVIHRVNKPEYVIHMLVVAPQEYMNLFSTHRVRHLCSEPIVAAKCVHVADWVRVNPRCF